MTGWCYVWEDDRARPVLRPARPIEDTLPPLDDISPSSRKDFRRPTPAIKKNPYHNAKNESPTGERAPPRESDQAVVLAALATCEPGTTRDVMRAIVVQTGDKWSTDRAARVLTWLEHRRKVASTLLRLQRDIERAGGRLLWEVRR